MDTTHRKFGLHIKTDDNTTHILRRYKNFHYNEVFQKEQGRSLKPVQVLLQERKALGFGLCLGSGAKLMVSIGGKKDE